MKNYFSGPFSDLLNEFVQFKRNTGFKYEKESHYLKQFSEFTLSQGITDPVLSKNLAEAWCNKKPFENQRNCTEQRISCLRQFALYLGSLGYDAYVPIHIDNKRSRRSKYVAYVFTHQEISAIISCSDKIYPYRRSTMHLVMPILVRLLYCTGLRINEALKLQLAHVDLVNGILRIEHAKFDKDRLIPLSPSMRNVLEQYCEMLHPLYLPDDYLFIGIAREPYSHHAIYYRFRELLQQAGIPHAGRGNGPRIHDIRHTFCCHTLQKSVADDVDLNAVLPILSVYLGHESIAATSQYLKMTAEVYPAVMEAVNSVCSFVIPVVNK